MVRRWVVGLDLWVVGFTAGVGELMSWQLGMVVRQELGLEKDFVHYP